MLSLMKESRVNKSGLLTVVVEPDFDMADDGSVWMLVKAHEAPKTPKDELDLKHFGGGYLHPFNCDCEQTDRLCDIGWLEEFVTCAGVNALLDDDTKKMKKRVELSGYMVSEKFEGIEGTDYDEYFDVTTINEDAQLY